ncbi:hypothetical protein [Sphingomonas gellani]|uniref:hypothetical protein n=1 Tax=Sphingomonas gellani TaxID=1166340 RepID=UPI000B89E598|nr:hypothetical protein [Sphingomonas gellani]
MELNADPSTLPTNLPILSDYPTDDAGWRAIDPALANAALGMHVERVAAQGRISDEWTYAGPSSAPFECARLAARTRLRAWDVASRLRRAYALPAYDPEYAFADSLRARRPRRTGPAGQHRAHKRAVRSRQRRAKASSLIQPVALARWTHHLVAMPIERTA